MLTLKVVYPCYDPFDEANLHSLPDSIRNSKKKCWRKPHNRRLKKSKNTRLWVGHCAGAQRILSEIRVQESFNVGNYLPVWRSWWIFHGYWTDTRSIIRESRNCCISPRVWTLTSKRHWVMVFPEGKSTLIPLPKSCDGLLVRKFGCFFAPQAVFRNLRKTAGRLNPLI